MQRHTPDKSSQLKYRIEKFDPENPPDSFIRENDLYKPCYKLESLLKKFEEIKIYYKDGYFFAYSERNSDPLHVRLKKFKSKDPSLAILKLIRYLKSYEIHDPS